MGRKRRRRRKKPGWGLPLKASIFVKRSRNLGFARIIASKEGKWLLGGFRDREIDKRNKEQGVPWFTSEIFREIFGNTVNPRFPSSPWERTSFSGSYMSEMTTPSMKIICGGESASNCSVKVATADKQKTHSDTKGFSAKELKKGKVAGGTNWWVAGGSPLSGCSTRSRASKW